MCDRPKLKGISFKPAYNENGNIDETKFDIVRPSNDRIHQGSSVSATETVGQFDASTGKMTWYDGGA